MSALAGLARVQRIGARHREAILLAGVSVLALSLPALSAPLVYDTNTTIITPVASAENVWVGFANPDVLLAIDATAGPASITTSGGNSFYLGTSNTADRTVVTLTGSAVNTAGIISADQVFVGNTSDDNTMTLNAFSSVTGTSLVLGVNAGSDGNLLELTTATSSIDLTSNLIVGYGGASNSVTLANGANIDVDGVVTLGNNVGASGNSLTLSSGSSLTATTGTTVGNADDGNSILVQSGADYTTYTTTLGALAGSDNNSVTVTGAGSTYTGTTNATFNVGGFGTGNSLMVSNGGVVSFGDRLAVGQKAGSNNNTVTITGAGSEIHAGNVRVGVTGSAATGNSLVVADGGYLDVTNEMKVRAGNTISVASGAIVDIGGTDGFVTEAGSTFIVDVDSSNAVDFDVTNAANLSGTLKANHTGGTLSNSYLVLTSGALTNNLTLDATGFAPGFTVTLDEQGNALYLLISADLGGTADLGDNEQNLADAINAAFGDGEGLSDGLVALFGVADGDLDAALAGATGEINAYAQTEMGWAGTEADLGLLTGPDLCTPDATGQICVHAFASGNGSHLDGDADQGNHDTTGAGLTLGVSAASRLAPGTVLSGLVTLDQSHAEVDGLGTADVTALRFGGSLKQDWSGFYASVGVVGGLGAGNTDRSFSSFTPGEASADFTQAYLGARGEIGADLAVTDTVKLTPFVAAQWANTSTAAFDETGTGEYGDLALQYGDSDRARTSADLGVRLATMPTDAGLVLAGTVAYRRVLGADDTVATEFQSLDGYSFDVTPATAPADQLRLSADLTLPVNAGSSITAKVDAGFGAGYQSAAAKLGFFGQW
jgi:T5SS/PEP-CTERM-associated repeat protein